MDKARERNDENHQQVVQILETPSSFMLEKLNSKNDKNKGVSKSQSNIYDEDGLKTQVDMSLAMNVLQQLVPVFCDIFQVIIDSF